MLKLDGVFAGRPELKQMKCPPELLDDLQKRLRRAEGQLRGIQRLLDEGADCEKILTQLAAAQGALDGAGVRMLVAGVRYCEANPEEAEAEGLSIARLEQLFTKIV